MGRRTGEVGLLLIALTPALFPQGSHAAADAYSRELSQTKKATFVRIEMPENTILATFQVEVVTKEDGLVKGLSGRESLPQEKGMLFLLSRREPQAFWMKGMRFPLDMIFLDKGKRILEIFENLQPCEQCSVIRSKEPADYVLEINAGLSRTYGLKKGDILVFETPE